MKVTIKSVEQLYELDRVLYNQIKRHLGGGIYQTNVLVDLPIAFAEAVKRFQDKNLIELWDEQKAQEKQAEIKRLREEGENEAAERVKFWFTCGLLSNQHNLDTLRRIIAERMAGNLIAFNVDVCMNRYRDEFQWKPVEPAPAPAPEPPPPSPVILSDGSHQLPLGTSPSTRHTVVQLQDLDARERAERACNIREANNALAAASKPVALEVV